MPKSQKRRYVIRFKITESELAAYREAAGSKATMTVNRWARGAANKAAGLGKRA